MIPCGRMLAGFGLCGIESTHVWVNHRGVEVCPVCEFHSVLIDEDGREPIGDEYRAFYRDREAERVVREIIES